MHSLCKTLIRGVVLAGFVVAWLATPGTASAATSPQAAAKAPAAHATGEFAGKDTCLGCHEDKGSALKDGPHARVFNPKSPISAQGCESCHGAGKEHAAAGGDTTKIIAIGKLSGQRASEICTTCHDRTKHALWGGSQHDQRNVGCTSCHSVHAAKGPKQLKAATEIALCGNCHKNITNKQNRFNHMPVREGKLSCSSCHNVHGSANVKLLKTGTTVNEACTSCHSEKRGPFLWEHMPVVENCTTCHDPHGTNNDRMLVAKQPFLCQRCHVTSRHPPTIYDNLTLKTSGNANKIYGRACAACHQMLHGSNAPTGKAFLR
ncbi:MAG: DmsE family decaheme c-type cytochrome [Acidobacteria bacterium]|nr:DmsE family decaheme c-type cytochrome [Acidobacteriota bacterium]